MTNPIILNIWTIVVEIFFLIAIFLYIVLTKLYTKEHKKYFLNIDYLFKGKNKKNKLILTSTIGNSNNSPRNVINIGQNYFGYGFHTEGNVKNNSTNKNKENLSIVLKKR